MNKIFYLDSSQELPKVGCDFLSGYAIIDDSIIFYDGVEKYKADGNFFYPDEGKFSCIISLEDEVVVKSDSAGQDTIFYFLENGFWAISNSFLTLLLNISKKTKLNLYKPGFSSFLLKNGWHVGAQIISSKTPVENVYLLPSSHKINIKRKTRRLEVSKSPTIPIESISYEEGIINFAEKAAGLLGSLSNNGYDIYSQLSGGYDSRMVLSLLLLSGDRERIYIQSHTHKLKDYEIAKGISKKFGLRVNEQVENQISLSVKEAFDVWRLSCLGTYLPVRVPCNYLGYHSKRVRLNGDVSTDWRFLEGNGLLHGTPLKVANDMSVCFKDGELGQRVKEDFISFFQEVDVDIRSPLATPVYYKELRSRFHCGRQWYKDLMGYKSFSPLTSKEMVAVDVAANKKGLSPKQVLADVFLATNPRLAKIQFDSKAKNFSRENFDSSPFKSGVSVSPRSFKVYSSDEQEFYNSSLLSTLTKNEMSRDEFSNDFFKLFTSELDAMKGVDVSDLLGRSHLERAGLERDKAKREGKINLSHGIRALTTEYYAKALRLLTDK